MMAVQNQFLEKKPYQMTAAALEAAGMHTRKRGLARRIRGMKTFALFFATAVAELAGCYLGYLVLKENRSPWLLLGAALSLVIFVWLLTFHETAAGRVYAAYGGVYIGAAILWLWIVDGIRPTIWDVAGVGIALVGAAVIMLQPR